MKIGVFLNTGASGTDEYREAVRTGIIQEQRRERWTEAIDSRTRKIDNTFYVIPFAKSETQNIVVCPFCRGLHCHGKCFGSRLAHCGKGSYIITEG